MVLRERLALPVRLVVTELPVRPNLTLLRPVPVALEEMQEEMVE